MIALPSHISFVRVDPSRALEAQAGLTDSERKRQASFGSDDRQATFALGRLAARLALSAQTGIRPAAVKLEVLEDGSLLPRDHAGSVSIAHSRDIAVAAASPGSVGIDLEFVKQRPDHLFRFMLHPDEMGWSRSPRHLNTAERIALLWSIKESVLKALRTGLRKSPKSLRIAELTDGVAIISDVSGGDWMVRWTIDGQFALSVAEPAAP